MLVVIIANWSHLCNDFIIWMLDNTIEVVLRLLRQCTRYSQKNSPFYWSFIWCVIGFPIWNITVTKRHLVTYICRSIKFCLSKNSFYWYLFELFFSCIKVYLLTRTCNWRTFLRPSVFHCEAEKIYSGMKEFTLIIENSIKDL